MSVMDLNSEETKVLNAMETCVKHRQIIDQHHGIIPPTIPMTPERCAVLSAMLHHTETMNALPNMLEHIGVDYSRLNVFEVVNYVSGYFYAGNKTQNPMRVLDPVLLIIYAQFCERIGKPINIYKIWYEFHLRQFPNAKLVNFAQQPSHDMHRKIKKTPKKQQIGWPVTDVKKQRRESLRTHRNPSKHSKKIIPQQENQVKNTVIWSVEQML